MCLYKHGEVPRMATTAALLQSIVCTVFTRNIIILIVIVTHPNYASIIQQGIMATQVQLELGRTHSAIIDRCGQVKGAPTLVHHQIAPYTYKT